MNQSTFTIHPGTFAGHFRHKGSGVAGHHQPNFEFRFSAGEVIASGDWEGCTYPSYVRKYDERLRKYGGFYQGQSDDWLFIEFWGMRDRIDEVGPALSELLEEICKDLEEAFGLKRVPLPSGYLYRWEKGYV